MSKPDYSGTYHLVQEINMDEYLEILGNIVCFCLLVFRNFRYLFGWTFILKASSLRVGSNISFTIFAEGPNLCNGIDYLY